MDASPGSLGHPEAERHASAEELAAYALDSDSLEIGMRTHIAGCPVCAPEASWLIEAVADLEAEGDCPPADEIIQFALGEATSEEQISIAAHLRDCAICQEEVELTRAAFQQQEPAPGLFEVIQRTIAALISSPALGTRGGQSASADASDVYAAGNTQITLRFAPYRDSADSYIVTGVINGPQPVQAAGVENVALLYALSDTSDPAPAALIAEAPITTSNAFGLFPVPAGTYRLEIVYGNRMIEISSVTIPRT